MGERFRRMDDPGAQRDYTFPVTKRRENEFLIVDW
jgi:hypothetical protein